MDFEDWYFPQIWGYFSPLLCNFAIFCSKILFCFLENIFLLFNRNLSVPIRSIETEILHLSLSLLLFFFSDFLLLKQEMIQTTQAFLSCSNNYAECCSVIQHPNWVNCFLPFFLSATPTPYGISWTRDQTHTSAAILATAKTLSPVSFLFYSSLREVCSIPNITLRAVLDGATQWQVFLLKKCYFLSGRDNC